MKTAKKQFINRGVELQSNGNYKAKTFLRQRTFASFSDAIQWLGKQGFDIFGRRPFEVENVTV